MTKGGVVSLVRDRKVLGAAALLAVALFGIQIWKTGLDRRASQPLQTESLATREQIRSRVQQENDLNRLLQGGYHLLKANELDGAELYLQRAREVSPDNRDANAFYAWLQLRKLEDADSTSQPQLLALAHTAAETAWHTDPTNPFAQELREVIRAAKGNQ